MNCNEVVAVGDSDHLGIIVTKCSKGLVERPKTVLKRSYKNFNSESFLTDVLHNNINNNVLSYNNLEEAAEQFENVFKEILDKHAPITTFQMHRNYSPYISQETKNKIKRRNHLKEEAVKTENKELEREAKLLGKEI